jgi:hypothetical protein
LASGKQEHGDVLETGKGILGLQACNNAIGEENPQAVEVATGLYRTKYIKYRSCCWALSQKILKQFKKNIEDAVGLYP